METKYTSRYYVFVIIVFILVVIALCSFLFRDISDNGRAVNATRTELAIAREEQQQARNLAQSVGQRLETSESIAREIGLTHQATASRVKAVKDRNATIGGILDENEKLIAESRSILKTVRGASEKER